MSFNEVYENLWIGGFPEDVAELRPFARIVMVAPLREHERIDPVDPPHTTRTLYSPFTDDIQPPSERERLIALHAARFAVEGLRAQQKTIVLCREGKNRSGLVVALALTQLTGCPGAAAIRIVQAARPHALYNVYFRELLEGIGAKEILT